MKEKMKNFLKENLMRLIVYASLAVLILIVILISFSAVYEVNEATISPQAAKSQSYVSSKSRLDAPSFTKMAGDLIYKKCTEGTSNNYITWCAVDLLDRKAAEREWKQRKLETWNPKNKNNLMDFEGSQTRITVWRDGLEEAEKEWCNATESTFYWGSAREYRVAQCILGFELAAINDLNFLYYDWINQYKHNDEDIADFEPTNADLDALIKTNIASQGCHWVSDYCEE